MGPTKSDFMRALSQLPPFLGWVGQPDEIKP
jgi:hypothetical protein